MFLDPASKSGDDAMKTLVLIDSDALTRTLAWLVEQADTFVGAASSHATGT